MFRCVMYATFRENLLLLAQNHLLSTLLPEDGVYNKPKHVGDRRYKRALKKCPFGWNIKEVFNLQECTKLKKKKQL